MKEELLALQKTIEKKFGAKTAISAEKVQDKERFLVPVSPALDIGLCGGVPSGSWVLISGPEKAGKTSLSLEIAKNAQKKFDCPVVLLNIEGRFKGQTTRAVEGIDLDNILVIESSEEKILTGEDFLNIAEDILHETPNCVLILDSVSRITTKASLDKEVSGTKRPTAPKLISDFVSRMAGVVPIKNSIVICIAQTYANISGYGSPIAISVPSAVKYQADIILKIKRVTEWRKKNAEKNEVHVGNILDWEIEHNAIGPPPTNIVTNYLEFGRGVSLIAEVASLGIELGIVNKSGKWYSIDDQKFDGEQKLNEYLEENPEVVQKLYNNIVEIFLDKEVLKDYKR